MEAVFLNLLNMSIAASWLVLAVVLLRLLLKKAPKALLCLLWGLVGVRLVFPIPFESILSLIPSAQTVPPDIMYSAAPTIDSGVPIVNSTVNPIISEIWAPQVGQSINPMQIITSVASWVWIVGIVGMILYTVISYLRLRNRVREAVPMEGKILLCDRIPSPFILGLFRPRIYLPSSMSKADMQYVIAHEKAHLKRRDHFWKPLGFAILTVYWFNPFMWLAYILLCRDIELACDEKVIKNMGEDIKKPYSNALINCSVPRKMIAACPLAFGEVSVKGRIKSVLNYKKPAFWIVIVAIIAGIVVSVCFLTNPKSSPDEIIQLKSGSELDGVSVEIVDSDFSSVDSFIEIKWNNETEKDVMYGEEFYIYKDSKDCRIGEYFWNDTAYLLPAEGSNTKKYSLSDMTMTETGEYRFETTCSIDGTTPYKEYKVWVEFELSPSAKLIYAYVFKPVELIYADTTFSYIQKAEYAPEYKIASNMHLQQQPKNKSKFSDLGQMTEITLNEDNFDSRFYPLESELSEKLSHLKKENKKAWELYVDDEYLYLLMEQKDGIFYLGFGYYNHDIMPKRNEDGSYIRHLYRLEKRKIAPQHQHESSKNE